jgi:hypothetical protein
MQDQKLQEVCLLLYSSAVKSSSQQSPASIRNACQLLHQLIVVYGTGKALSEATLVAPPRYR